MRRTGVIGYVCLLVIPALLAGMTLHRWLRLEQSNIGRAVESAAVEQARAVAGTMRLAVEDITRAFSRSLEDRTPETVMETLRRDAAQNPLIRNVFIWREPQGLVFPSLLGATAEEQRFASRYEALFRNPDRWVEAAPDPVGSGSSRTPAHRGGWIRWTVENQVELLGWSEFPDGTRYGLELETMALMSRLATKLPDRMPPGQTMALVDAAGRIVCQRGEMEADPAMPRVTTAYLAPMLPHGELVVYQTGAGLMASGQRAGRMLLLLLATIFVLAPLSGGAMLLWQSQRDARDARRKTTFVSNVSHELKTPLTTIRMYAEMLESGRVKDESRRADYLETIVRESQRLTRLVNNVLDFGRMEQGRKRYAPQAFDAAEAVRLVVREQELRLKEAGMELTLDASDPCPVTMDRDAFEQTMLNLVDNAIKYAASGRALHVSVCDREVRISDEGPGISSGARDKIFERFFRGDESLTATQPGSGLGLTIARRLMRDQGGEVTLAESERGACFVIRLPGSKADVKRS